jgi:preprotein translocase subunit SecA
MNLISRFIPPQSIDEMWDPEGLEKALEGDFGIEVPVRHWLEEDHDLDESGLRERVMEAVEAHYKAKEEMTGSEVMRQFEKAVMLSILDQQWKEHLASMDYLRRGINLRSFAQKKPQQEFKREGFEMFTAMLESMKHEVMKARAGQDSRSRMMSVRSTQPSRETPMQFQHAEAQSATVRPAGGQPGCGRSGQARDLSSARGARLDATSRARAVRARNTSSATASWDRTVSGFRIMVSGDIARVRGN